MAVLDTIEKSKLDYSEILENELDEIIFSPRDYNRVILVYNDFYDKFAQPEENVAVNRILSQIEKMRSLLNAFGIPFQIGLTTEDEMMQSGAFDKPISEMKRLESVGFTHSAPVGKIIAILFKIENCSKHYRQSVRMICNLYAMITSIVQTPMFANILTFSQYEDLFPEKYHLCNDRKDFPKYCYEIMSGTHDYVPGTESCFAYIWCGDYGVGIATDLLEKFKQLFIRLNDLHKKDKGITLFKKLNVTIKKPIRYISI